MQSVSCLNDLKRFGIILLTSEADHLGFRILCDLTPKGKKIAEETYGMTASSENWNASASAVASMMLPEHAWRELAIVGFFLEGRYVIETDTTVFGLADDEKFHRAEYDWEARDPDGKPVLIKPAMLESKDEEMLWPADLYGKILRTYEGSDHPRVGTRNVHQMSGRSH